MAAEGIAARADRSGGGDVLRRLRTGTAQQHEEVERILDLLDPALGRGRLVEVLDRMRGFWAAAEAGLDAWAAARPEDADAVAWPRRHRAALFAADVQALGGTVTREEPRLPPVTGTDAALGRLYVLEGATLGGTSIDRHLASLPQLSGARIRAFSPYGSDTGAMWAHFRRVTRDRVDAGGDPEVVVDAARVTFAALAVWCRPAGAARGVPA
jgi:heme oxygenase